MPKDLIITSAKIAKGICDFKNLIIEKKQIKINQAKKVSQPSQVKTCGSTFKNSSEEKKAWKLIRETGCFKFKEGDAEISKKHCNFFVNNGNASSADIENLINRVKQTIIEKTGLI